jgi:peptidoglycan/LPS O-acetylase OafA/YrhL
MVVVNRRAILSRLAFAFALFVEAPVPQLHSLLDFPGGVFLLIERSALFAGSTVAYTNPERLTFGSDTRADSMLVGCFLGIWLTSHSPFQKEWTKKALMVCAPISVAGLLYLGTCSVVRPGMVYFGWFLASIFAAILILSLLFAPGPHRWLFENPILAYVGRISYGIYLWHVPILTVMQKHDWPWRRLVYLVPVAVTTLACFYLVEVPCLRLKSRFVHANAEGGVNSTEAKGC